MSVLCVCMREEISPISAGRLGSCGFCVLVASLCDIFILMWSGKSLHVSCILPLGMLCLSAKSIMFVNVVFAVCTSVGGVMSEKAASVWAMNCSQSVFL